MFEKRKRKRKEGCVEKKRGLCKGKRTLLV
jgi:hypothetical protein